VPQYDKRPAAIGAAVTRYAQAVTPRDLQPGEIIVPGQPPMPGTGSGQVTSGAS
jgi:hypothetical protein